MSGHGHVTPNKDGSKARCGGPAICRECRAEAGQFCKYCREPKPDMVRLRTGAAICEECAVERSDCNRGRR